MSGVVEQECEIGWEGVGVGGGVVSSVILCVCGYVYFMLLEVIGGNMYF